MERGHMIQLIVPILRREQQIANVMTICRNFGIKVKLIIIARGSSQSIFALKHMTFGTPAALNLTLTLMCMPNFGPASGAKCQTMWQVYTHDTWRNKHSIIAEQGNKIVAMLDHILGSLRPAAKLMPAKLCTANCPWKITIQDWFAGKTNVSPRFTART